MKAFIFDPLWNKLITDELLDELKGSGLELIIKTEVAPIKDCAELYEGDEDRILCLNPDYVSWSLKEEDYKDIPNLKAILGAATSISWMEGGYAAKNGIAICDIKNFSTESVAEWAITMMLNVSRQIPRLIRDGFPLAFDKDFMKYRGLELRGKKAGIVGLGNIGAAIAKRCEGLGMEVVYWSKSAKENEYDRVELNDIFKECDVIFPAMALNKETESLITDERLKSMKKTAMFISIVHDMYNEELLLDMVKRGDIFGYGFEGSPKSFNKYQGNVWAAPSYAWATDSSMNKSMKLWVENMVQASKNKLPNKVN